MYGGGPLCSEGAIEGARAAASVLCTRASMAASPHCVIVIDKRMHSTSVRRSGGRMLGLQAGRLQWSSLPLYYNIVRIGVPSGHQRLRSCVLVSGQCGVACFRRARVRGVCACSPRANMLLVGVHLCLYVPASQLAIDELFWGHGAHVTQPRCRYCTPLPYQLSPWCWQGFL